MRKVFIDCGAHWGEGLLELYSKLELDKTWKIISFEANEECLPKFKKNTKHIENLSILTKVVWIKDEFIYFHKNTPPNSSINDGGGSTIIPLDNWNVECAGPGRGTYEHDVFIGAIDFSNFINSFDIEDKIIVKMDIEGAEYDVLEKMINDGTAQRISELYIEWHEWAMIKPPKFNSSKLNNELEQLGVKIFNWH